LPHAAAKATEAAAPEATEAATTASIACGNLAQRVPEGEPMIDVRRRQFITLLGGAAAAWPLAGRAQQGELMRRIGHITGVTEADPEYQARIAELRRALQQLGWTEGRNIQIDQRFGSTGDSDLVRKHTRELVALAPNLIVTSGVARKGP
jgi:hypothetical protein